MSKKKYYAVKVGKIQGIYFTWNDCAEQVNGFKGAIYKSFENIEDALLFIEEEKEESKKDPSKKPCDKNAIRSTAKVKVFKKYIDPKDIAKENDLVVFVDGSYDKHNKVFGSGIIEVNPEEETYECYYNSGIDKWDQWNIVGELEAVKFAINKASKDKKKNIAIYHDLKNIALWASGEWQAKNEYTQDYVRFIEKMSEQMNISFIKVKAHSTESRYNDLADEAAKGAIIKYLNNEK